MELAFDEHQQAFVDHLLNASDFPQIFAQAFVQRFGQEAGVSQPLPSEGDAIVFLIDFTFADESKRKMIEVRQQDINVALFLKWYYFQVFLSTLGNTQDSTE